MEPINDLQHMTELFNELKRRNLVVELSPPGRGQVVSHNLYPEWELEQLRKSVAAGISAISDSDESTSPPSRSMASAPSLNVESNARMVAMESEIESLKQTVMELQDRLSKLEKDLGVV